MTCCALAVASLAWRPPIADMKPSMARRSGSVTAVDVPFEDLGPDFLRRGFFNTGIVLLLLCYPALLIIVVALYTSIAEHVCPPFLPGPVFCGATTGSECAGLSLRSAGEDGGIASRRLPHA